LVRDKKPKDPARERRNDEVIDLVRRLGALELPIDAGEPDVDVRDQQTKRAARATARKESET
jgi:hypothetical protein